MKKICIFLIRIYQKTFSVFLGRKCRFFPSCSEYTIEAIKKYGVIKGSYLGIKRIGRCNPMHESGFDFVP